MRANSRLLNVASALAFACYGSGAVTECIAAKSRPEQTAARRCLLCSNALPVPVVKLSYSELDSVAHSHAEFNRLQIARIDSLYRRGHFGEPGSKSARQNAHLYVRLKTVNAYPDFIRMATDTTRVYEGTGDLFRELNRRYSDAVVFCAVRAKRVRLGLGRVCIHYDVTGKASGVEAHGGRLLRWRTTSKKIEGTKRQLVSVDLPTSTDKVVEALFAPHYTCRVWYSGETGPPGPYDWYGVSDIDGAWLRKLGTHRPTGYMFWVTPQWTSTGPGAEKHAAYDTGRYQPAVVHTAMAKVPVGLTETPLVGVRIYIPGLRFRLPSLIPDIPLDDLREVELPMPILETDYLRRQQWPSWLGSGDNLTFGDWKGHGPVPATVRERFPDR